jgi:hypothetical protein
VLACTLSVGVAFLNAYAFLALQGALAVTTRSIRSPGGRPDADKEKR